MHFALVAIKNVHVESLALCNYSFVSMEADVFAYEIHNMKHT